MVLNASADEFQRFDQVGFARAIMAIQVNCLWLYIFSTVVILDVATLFPTVVTLVISFVQFYSSKKAVITFCHCCHFMSITRNCGKLFSLPFIVSFYPSEVNGFESVQQVTHPTH